MDNLVIVESPAKAKTIEKFLGKNYLVKSSFGHIRDLAKKELGVKIEKDYEPDYIVPSDKKKVVTELKESVKDAKTVWLASDEDREGEAIAWHLAEVLKLKDENTKRIVFHEITKKAILSAIEKPRSINKNLVDAQQARRILDRLVGFELSPVLWRKIKPSLSAGRVQSVAVKLLVEREREIQNFKSVSSFKVVGIFITTDNNGKEHSFKAELSKKFKTKEEAQEFLNKCNEAAFKIADVTTKPATKSPSAPFTTSTLQQEASRKLGFSVSRTMAVAQKLYEAGKITYMRTDSVNLSDDAVASAKNEIETLYGKEYYKMRRYSTKSKGAQEAHEAIRPTYLNHSTIKGAAQEAKLYELIWKRTIASQMSNALFDRTVANIDISNRNEKFVANGEIIKFDGFLKVYIASVDEDKEEEQKGFLPPLKKDDKLIVDEINATERFANHPPRYTEASLVRKLEELGIGRPSTYAPTISTIQNRGYVVKESREGEKRNYEYLELKNKKVQEKTRTEIAGREKNKLFPTDIAMVVTDFLSDNFGVIMEYNFTADVEKEFDEIANGKMKWRKMIDKFYKPFHTKVETTLSQAEKHPEQRHLGDDPKTGKPVYVKIGRYGPMVQLGEASTKEKPEKPQFASLLKNQRIDTITLEEALELFKLPRTLGKYEDKTVVVGIGRFGPYVRHDGKFVSLKKGIDDPMEIGLERAIELIKEKREADAKKHIKSFDEEPELKVLNGRWGPYISFEGKNYKIRKGTEAEKLTLEDCKKIIEKGPSKSKGKSTAKKTKSKAKSKSKTTKTKTKK